MPEYKRPTSFGALSGHSGGDSAALNSVGASNENMVEVAADDDKSSGTISGLTTDEFSGSDGHRHHGSSIKSPLHRDNSILPRSSLQQRISDRINEFSLSKLKFDQLPLIGRERKN